MTTGSRNHWCPFNLNLGDSIAASMSCRTLHIGYPNRTTYIGVDVFKELSQAIYTILFYHYAPHNEYNQQAILDYIIRSKGTKKLLLDVKGATLRGAGRFLKTWRDNVRVVNTTKQLLECYWSYFPVIRIIASLSSEQCKNIISLAFRGTKSWIRGLLLFFKQHTSKFTYFRLPQSKHVPGRPVLFHMAVIPSRSLRDGIQ